MPFIMDRSKLSGGPRMGDSGDITKISLSDMTTINQDFLRFINGNQSSKKEINEKPSSNIDQSIATQPKNDQTQANLNETFTKPSPVEMAEQLLQKLNPRKAPQLLKSSEETIKSLMREKFDLQLQIHKLRHSKEATIDASLHDNLYTELIQALLAENERLKKKVGEIDFASKREKQRKEGMSKNSFCQTLLDSYVMEQLVKSTVELRKIKEQQMNEPRINNNNQHQANANGHQYYNQQSEHNQYQHPSPIDYNRQSHSKLPKDHPQRHTRNVNMVQNDVHRSDQQRGQTHEVMTQLHYPNVTLPKQVQQDDPLAQPYISNKQMSPDEKEILGTVFNALGTLTTVEKKLKAVISDVT